MSPEQFLSNPVGIIANINKPIALQATRRIIDILDMNSIDWFLEANTAKAIGNVEQSKTIDELVTQVTWVIVVGGDGTILQAVRDIGEYKIPMIGVNPGLSFGFMADTTVEELLHTITSIKNDDYEILKRMTLKSSYWDSKTGEEHKMKPALNDITFVHGAHARLIELEVRVDDDILSNYAVDGLIFATATGSTAHSMSAGGPVLFPTTEAFVMTPICPHTLANRPIIIPSEHEVEVKVCRERQKVFVAIDGHVTREFYPNDRVTMKLEDSAHFIRTRNRSFVNVLQEKLHWRGYLRNDE